MLVVSDVLVTPRCHPQSSISSGIANPRRHQLLQFISASTSIAPLNSFWQPFGFFRIVPTKKLSNAFDLITSPAAPLLTSATHAQTLFVPTSGYVDRPSAMPVFEVAPHTEGVNDGGEGPREAKRMTLTPCWQESCGSLKSCSLKWP